MSEFAPRGEVVRKNTPEVRQVTHRDYEGYLSLFNLPEEKLAAIDTVIDVGAGFSSFVEEVRKRNSNIQAIAVDPIYGSLRGNISAEDFEKQEGIFLDLDPSYTDGEIGGKEAFDHFIEEITKNPNSYLPASHQDIPLRNECADLVLASNSLIRTENQPSVIKRALEESVRVLKSDGEIRIAGAMACFEYNPDTDKIELWYNGELIPNSPQIEELKKTGRYADPELMKVFADLEADDLHFYAIIAQGKDHYGNDANRVDTLILRKDEKLPEIKPSDSTIFTLRRMQISANDGFNIPLI